MARLETANHVEIEQRAPNVHALRLIDFDIGGAQKFLILADLHLDNPRCQRDALRRTLDRAIDELAIVMVFGDLFDAMQGPRDPRASAADLDPKHLTPAYFDSIVDDAVQFLSPYAPLLGLITKGNHETAVTKHYGRDLIDNLTRELRRERGCYVQAGGYGGWIQVMLNRSTVRSQSKWKYHHGAGGGAVMSFGTLDTRRKASFLPDCDVFISSHTHDAYVLPVARERLTDHGVIYKDVLWNLRVGTFKDDYGDNSGGFAAERGHAPKPIGGIWGTLTALKQGMRLQFWHDIDMVMPLPDDLDVDPLTTE